MKLRFSLAKSFIVVLGFASNLNAGLASFKLAEIQRHSSTHDCWIVIDNKVYDLTKYLIKHPTKPEVLNQYCGKDATAGWSTKDIPDKPLSHTKKAHLLLRKFEVGQLEKE